MDSPSDRPPDPPWPPGPRTSGFPPVPPAPPGRDPRPVRLVLLDRDLSRNRLTVAFRLLLAIPLLIWLGLWSAANLPVGLVTWVAVLVTTRVPRPLAEYFAAYVRFATHLYAYLSFAAERYPSFVGRPGYAVDVEIDPAPRQRRWTVALRLLLALPALLLSSTLDGSIPVPSSSLSDDSLSSFDLAGRGGGAIVVVGLLGWFVCLVRGRMSPGLRDLAAYALGYGAQATSYLALLTDRYPSADPACVTPPLRVPPHPVRARSRDDLRRSRLMVALRLPLLFPHLAWLTLWSAIVLAIAPVVWLVVLVLGRLPLPLHRFQSAWARAHGQVLAFATLTGGPFPGFVGAPGYPVEIELDGPGRQRRLVTASRALLAFPAYLLASAYVGALVVASVLLWLAGLVTGRAPDGLQAFGVAAVRYAVQVLAYASLVTDRYPYASPGLEGEVEAPAHEQLEIFPAAAAA